jgi:hypothetical protein
MVFTVPSSDALAAGDAATGATGAWAWAADAKPVAPARERKTPRQNAILSETELFRVAIRILYWIWYLPPGMLSPPGQGLGTTHTEPALHRQAKLSLPKDTSLLRKSFDHGNISTSNRARIMTNIQRNLHRKRAVPYSVQKDPKLSSNHVALVASFHALVPLPVARSFRA